MSEMIIKLLSTDAAITLIAGLFVTYLVRFLATKEAGEKFLKYEGYAITAIKAAEKAIPDDTPNKGLNRLDFALRMFLTKYQQATGKKPSEAEVSKIESWISQIHSVVEASGVLGKI
jgi:hypothetical protein